MIDQVKLGIVESEIKQHFPVPVMYNRILGFYGDLLEESVCCPFHEEKTPSFSYSKRLGIWACFGQCNKRGDTIELYRFYLEKHKGIKVSRQIAIEMLMKIPEVNSKLSIKDVTSKVTLDLKSYMKQVSKELLNTKLKEHQKETLKELNKLKHSEGESFIEQYNILLYSKIRGGSKQ